MNDCISFYYYYINFLLIAELLERALNCIKQTFAVWNFICIFLGGKKIIKWKFRNQLKIKSEMICTVHVNRFDAHVRIY